METAKVRELEHDIQRAAFDLEDAKKAYNLLLKHHVQQEYKDAAWARVQAAMDRRDALEAKLDALMMGQAVER